MTNTNIYTRLNNLVCALRADEDNCDLVGTVRDTVDSCRNYVGMVDRMEANIRTARETMDAEDFRRRVQTLDMNMQEDVESVVINAGKYVAAVTEMECSVRNMQGLKGQDYRDRVSQTDTARTRAHNAFIDAVNLANRLAESVNAEKIYTGSSERRAYGDFAFAIVKEIFESRK